MHGQPDFISRSWPQRGLSGLRLHDLRRSEIAELYRAMKSIALSFPPNSGVAEVGVNRNRFRGALRRAAVLALLFACLTTLASTAFAQQIRLYLLEA